MMLAPALFGGPPGVQAQQLDPWGERQPTDLRQVRFVLMLEFVNSRHLFSVSAKAM
jgi:hypothetical protein